MHKSPVYCLSKFTADKILSLGLLVLALPLIAAIACAIKCSSKGPVFFYQRRGGLNGTPFYIIKFRTMLSDASRDEAAPQAQKNDPRFAPLGALLRRHSLDELPQLFNVMLGHMSLVGPRPHALHHDHEFTLRCPEYVRRFRVKPGMTGWAQVHGYRGLINSETDIHNRTRLDNDYIDNWTPLLELRILLRTLIAPLWSPNAH